MTDQVRPVAIDEIHPHPSNPKAHDLSTLTRSIQRFGFVEPIVVDQRTSLNISGHGRVEALTELRDRGADLPDGITTDPDGRWLAPVFVGWSSANDAEAEAALVALNRIGEAGGWDDRALADLLSRLDDIDGGMDGIGYHHDDLVTLREQLDALSDGAAGQTDPDDVPDAPATPVSKLGDVWLLGRHRVICGDSTDVGVLDRVMDGGKARMVWTDPPYGVVYVGSGRAAAEGTERKSIANDSLSASELDDLLRASFAAAFSASEEGASWYVAAPPGPTSLSFTQALTDLGIWRQTLAWIKDTFVIGRSDYHGRHETIYYGWVPGAAHTWESDRKQDTVLEFPRPRKSKEHPTMKPVELIEYCIGNSSKRGAVVLDPFGGSGSTLLASHRTGRTARLVELDPAYVDVICRRYQEHTGEKPVLVSTGQPHDFAANANP